MTVSAIADRSPVSAAVKAVFRFIKHVPSDVDHHAGISGRGCNKGRGPFRLRLSFGADRHDRVTACRFSKALRRRRLMRFQS